MFMLTSNEHQRQKIYKLYINHFSNSFFFLNEKSFILKHLNLFIIA